MPVIRHLQNSLSEHLTGEVRRISLLRTRVNKGKKRKGWASTPWPFRIVGWRLALLDPHRIPTADCAALLHCTIDTDIDLIVLSGCAQDAQIPR
jgi:hypothetical protein